MGGIITVSSTKKNTNLMVIQLKRYASVFKTICKYTKHYTFYTKTIKFVTQRVTLVEYVQTI